MNNERTFNLFIGAPRSGKSTKTVDLIKKYRQNVIIVKHRSNINDATHSFLTEKTPENFRQGAKPGEFVKCKMAFSDKKEYLPFLNWVRKEYRNGLLIIDDATIFERDRLSLEMTDIVSMRRHYGIDVVLIYHGFSLCPIDQFVFVNYLIIFNTNDNIEYKKTKIPQFDRVEAARMAAKQNYSSSNPKVKFKPVVVNITSM